jgi:Ca2+-binding EF-hand superfamily protein
MALTLLGSKQLRLIVISASLIVICNFSNASLNVLLKTLHTTGSVKDRENFFLSMVGVRRRMERKWQETPLAKIFTVPDMFTSLKHQALSIFIVESLKAKSLTVWEAFTAFDHDNNGLISPAEFYGALLWLNAPDLNAEDVVDFFEVADKNRDGQIDYREYVDFLTLPGTKPGELLTEEEGTEEEKGSGKDVHIKVEPYGAEELREIILRRKQAEQIRQREERLKKQAYKDALDIKIFEEELEASRLRKGGQNPLMSDVSTSVYLPSPTQSNSETFTVKSADEFQSDEKATKNEDVLTGENGEPIVTVSDKDQWIVTDFKFSTNQEPLRFTAAGKYSFIPILYGTPADKPVVALTCRRKHRLDKYNYYWMNCTLCSKRATDYVCWNCGEYICRTCYDGHKRIQEMERRDPERNPTFLRCQQTCSFTLQIPMRGGADPLSGDFTLTLELRVTKLPPKSQLQSLLRFSLPDLSQAKRVHRTSVYLNGDGVIVGRPIEIGGEVIYPDPEPIVEETAAEEKASGETITEEKNGNEVAKAEAASEDSSDSVVAAASESSSAQEKDTEAIVSEEKMESTVEEESTGEAEEEEKEDAGDAEEGKEDVAEEEENEGAGDAEEDGPVVEKEAEKKEKKVKKDKKKKQKKVEAADGEEKKEKKPIKPVKQAAGKIRPGKWAVVTVVVQPSQCRLVSYVDGSLCHVAEDLDPADLRLQHKVVVLGGGKMAHVRGGDVRRMVVHSAAMSTDQVRSLYYAVAQENPAIGGLLVKAQALYRRYRVRKTYNLAKLKQVERGEQENDSDESEEEYDEDCDPDSSGDY